jgi:hypothetical protein
MDISNLIKEAKPLYFKRKRRRRMIKNISVGVVSCLMMGVFMMQNPTPTVTNQDFYTYLYDEEAYNQDFYLLTEADMLLPMDEYEMMELS